MEDTKDKKAVIFIDGNNFYHNLRHMKIDPNTIDFKKLCKAVCSYFNVPLKEIRYYNSMPHLEDNKDKYWKQYAFFDSLRKEGIEVTTRKLQRLSNKERIEKQNEIISTLGICETCFPLVKINCYDCIGDTTTKEKGIDVMIAIGMVEYAINQKCDYIILISGDADFIPALELAEQNGISVCSAFLTKGYSSDIRKKFRHLSMGEKFVVSCLK